MTAQVWLSTNYLIWSLFKKQFFVCQLRGHYNSEGRLGGTIEPELSFGFATSAHVVSDDFGVSVSTTA
jgi:hypothetical protein